MKITIALIVGALAASPLAASPTSEITEANARWTEAVAHKDMATVEAIVAPDFRLTGGDATKAVPRALPGWQRSRNLRSQITRLRSRTWRFTATPPSPL